MTEQEFKRQVWRAFDTVDIADVGNNLRVIAVGFFTKTVRVSIAPNVTDWFNYEQILRHYSATGEPDDLAIIADLHNKLMKANERIEKLQSTICEQNEKIKAQNLQLKGKPTSEEELRKIRKAVNKSIDAVNSINARMKSIDEFLNKLGVKEEDEEVIDELREPEVVFREILHKTLELTNRNLDEAAAKLGISKRTLSSKIKEYGL